MYYIHTLDYIFLFNSLNLLSKMSLLWQLDKTNIELYETKGKKKAGSTVKFQKVTLIEVNI